MGVYDCCCYKRGFIVLATGGKAIVATTKAAIAIKRSGI